MFVDEHNKRRTIYLGNLDKKTAQTVLVHVEHLVNAKLTGSPPPRETASWLSSIGGALQKKLAKVGLVDTPEFRQVPKLSEFVTSYLKIRQAEVKPSTMAIVNQAARWLLRSVDPKKRIDQVTPHDADKARATLLQGRARSTANKRTRYLKELFKPPLTAASSRRTPSPLSRGWRLWATLDGGK